MRTGIRRVTWKAGALAMLLSLALVTVGVAASGGLDATFSGDGRQTTDFGPNYNDWVFAMALQSDGKVVAVGSTYDPANPSQTSTDNFALARYNTNGSLDATFSGDGKLMTDFGGFDNARGVAIQSNGKIVVSGRTCSAAQCDLAVARYNTNGWLDTAFSGDGRQVIPFGKGQNATYGGIAIQPDGKIVIAGYMVNSNGNYDFAAYRLNTDGSPDATFSGDGRVNIGFGSGRLDDADDLVLQNGKIVLAGETCGSTCVFAVVRLNSNGSLDSTFSSDGKQVTDFGPNAYGYAVALQPDGKIVVAGEKQTSITSYMAFARYNMNGSHDLTFNGTGRKVLGVGTSSRPFDVLVQGNGKIVAAGGVQGTDRNFAIVRMNPNGSLDATFSGDGKASVDFGGGDEARALLRQSDGKYVLGGLLLGSVKYDFALARLLP